MRKVHSLRDAREICADGTYFPNNLRKWIDETRNQCETYTDGDQKSKVERQLPYLDLSTDDSKRTWVCLQAFIQRTSLYRLQL